MSKLVTDLVNIFSRYGAQVKAAQDIDMMISEMMQLGQFDRQTFERWVDVLRELATHTTFSNNQFVIDELARIYSLVAHGLKSDAIDDYLNAVKCYYGQ